MFRRLVLMSVSLSFTSPVSRLMSVSLSAMFWRFDSMSVSLTCTREVNRITSSSMRTTSGAWLSRSKPSPFTPVSGSTVSSSMTSRTGLQRCRLNVLRDYQRAGGSAYSNITGTLESNPLPSILTCMPLLKLMPADMSLAPSRRRNGAFPASAPTRAWSRDRSSIAA